MDGSMTAAFEKEFSISLWSFVPAVVMIALPLLKVGVIKAMTASIVTGLLVACMVQDVPVFDAVRICIAGYESQSEGIGTILNGGGLLSMVEIAVILVISSTYSGIFSGTGMRLSLQHKLAKACSKVGRFAVMVCMSIGIAAIFCNQTIGTLMCCDIMKKPYLDGGGTREELAIDMENSVILIACFIPWSIGCSVPLALLGQMFHLSRLRYICTLCRYVICSPRKGGSTIKCRGKILRLFDNKVQEIKYKVLREVAYQAWHGNEALLNSIP